MFLGFLCWEQKPHVFNLYLVRFDFCPQIYFKCWHSDSDVAGWGMRYWYCKGFHLIHGCEIPFCGGESHAAIHMPTPNRGDILSQCLLLTIVITLGPDKRDTLMAYYSYNNNIIRCQEKNTNFVFVFLGKKGERHCLFYGWKAFLLQQTWMGRTQFNGMIWTSDPGSRLSWKHSEQTKPKIGGLLWNWLFCAIELGFFSHWCLIQLMTGANRFLASRGAQQKLHKLRQSACDSSFNIWF